MRRGLLAVLLSLFACAAGVEARVAAKPATVQITIDTVKFTPASVTVKPGDTVIWTNKDILAHTVTAQSGAFDSKVIMPGGTWKFVARKKGDFPYKCVFHPMTGSLTVQ
jgi:plastocyanin